MARPSISPRKFRLPLHAAVLCASALVAGAAPASGPSAAATAGAAVGPGQLPPPAPQTLTPLNALPKGYQGADTVVAQAKRAGVRSCLPQLDKIVHYLGTNVQLGTQPFFTPSGQDMDLVSLSMELSNPSSLSFASAEIAPVITPNCAFTYDTVTYWPQGCDLIGVQAFPNMHSEGVLANSIRVMADSAVPLMRVYLMPAGPGCVSIKKEVWF